MKEEEREPKRKNASHSEAELLPSLEENHEIEEHYMNVNVETCLVLRSTTDFQTVNGSHLLSLLSYNEN
ncbi:hypothetical protein Nepgr_009915 [Nepenthes gracilis]|uniref:Uncharacterized protein n=1 Tax=Nepenthes gracilis TaxID=150966 RepID=A0AAD3SBB8_NEPGR|nr:hypothetical protein Nepgr_009915 [Nepenthes gracilis]